MTWNEVDDGSAGQRIDNFLIRTLKGVPKSHIYRIVRSGEVRVNSRRIDVTYRLVLGDQIRIPPVRVAADTAARSTAGLRPGRARLRDAVIYEDDALIALLKPAGLAAHGGSGVSHGAIEQMRAEHPELRFLELVHRLDRDTSGILLFAKKRSALSVMHQMMRDGAMDKRYLALVQGRFADARRAVKASLQKYTAADGERRVMVQADGQEAHTIFHRRQVWAEASLLEAQLMTGRTHQIRVHLAHLRHPIAGDDKYGDFAWNRELGRQGLRRMFLHAARLNFAHPLTGVPLRLEAPLPADLTAHLESLAPWPAVST